MAAIVLPDAAHYIANNPMEVGKGHTADRLGESLARVASEVFSLTRGTATAQDMGKVAALIAQDPLVQILGESIVVDATTTGSLDELSLALEGAGATLLGKFGSLVSALVPLDQLDELNALAGLTYATVSTPPITHIGNTTTLGDVAQKADEVRSFFGFDGTGQKVGVLSDSYNFLGGASSDVTSGDLPGTGNPFGNTTAVQVVAETPSGLGGVDEGRAMLQIVHDVAPKAQLAFATANGGQAAFASNITALRNAGATVIVDDALYPDEPMFMDGVIAQAADAAVAAGVPYVSAVGNWERKSYEAASYTASGVFYDYGAGPVELHDFDPGPGVDAFQQITIPLGQTVTFAFQWEDPFLLHAPSSGGATRDFDILLVDGANPSILRDISAFDNTGNDPVEVFQYTNNTGSTSFSIALAAFSTSGSPRLKYVAFNNNVTINQFATNSGSSYGHINASSVLSVGAANYVSTPDFGVSPPVLELFSSAGGVPILFDTSGTPISPVTRQTPDLVGPDGGNTTFFGADTGDPDAFPNFFGTSAAAPHVAALVALLKDADASLTPAQLASALESTAINMGAAGYDFDSGWGFVNAPLAFSAAGGPYAVTFPGTSASDSMLIRKDASGSLKFLLGGVLQFEFPQSDISTVSVLGGLGSDTLQVDYGGGPISVPITYNGEAGFNDLQVTGYAASAVNVIHTSSSSGTIQVGTNSAIAFTNHDDVHALGVNDSVAIEVPSLPLGPFPPGTDLATYIGDDLGNLLGLSQVDGGFMAGTVFSNPIKNLTVTLAEDGFFGGVTMQNLDANFNPTGAAPFSAPLRLIGSNGSDSFRIESVQRENGQGYGGLLIEGGAGNDSMDVLSVDAVLSTLVFNGQGDTDSLMMFDSPATMFYKLTFNPTTDRLQRAETLANFNAGVFNREIKYSGIEGASLDAGGGTDRLDIYGASGVQESVTVGGATSASISRNGGQQSFSSSNFEEVRALSHMTLGGDDSLTLTGSGGADTLTAYFDHGTFSGGVNFQYSGFKHVTAYPGGGADTVFFVPTADNDKLMNNLDLLPSPTSVTDAVGFFYGNTDTSQFSNNASFKSDAMARGFKYVYVNAYTGAAPDDWDKAYITGTTGNDYFETKLDGTWNRYSYLADPAGNLVHVRNFGLVDAYAMTGNDTAGLYDTAGDWDFLDVPTWDTTKVYLNSQIEKYFNWTTGFDTVNVFTTGYDNGKNDRRNTSFPFVNVVTPSHWDVV